MTFEQRCTIPVACEELWKFLLDVPQMALCVPGTENVVPAGDDKYTGILRVKVGPIHLSLRGVLTIEERDQEHWHAVARAEAKDGRVPGGAIITGNMTLIDKDPAATELVIKAQLRLLGKLGEFGEPIIRKQADTIITTFARNVVAHFENTPAIPEVTNRSIAAPHLPPQTTGYPEAAAAPSSRVIEEARERTVPPAASARIATPLIPLVAAFGGLILAIIILGLIPLPTSSGFAWLIRTAIIALLILSGLQLGKLLLRRREKNSFPR